MMVTRKSLRMANLFRRMAEEMDREALRLVQKARRIEAKELRLAAVPVTDNALAQRAL